MKRKIGCLLIVLCILSNISAQDNFFHYASAVWIENNGNGQFYNIYSISTTTSGRTYTAQENAIEQGGGNWQSALFQGRDFGSHAANSHTLLFRGAEVKTYKKNSGNVCSAKVFYVVYPQGQRPSSPSFTEHNIAWFDNCDLNIYLFPDDPGHGPCNESGYQKWQSWASGGVGHLTENTVLDLTQMKEGKYTLELYYQVNGSNTVPNGCSETVYINNGGNNYKANFTVCPVISVASVVQPTSCGGNGQIILTTAGIENGTYSQFYYTDASNVTHSFGNVQVFNNSATLIVPSGTYNNIRYESSVSGCSPSIAGNVTLSDPPLPVISSITKSNATCFGTSTGWIEVTVTGGSGQYFFSKDGGITFTLEPHTSPYRFENLPAADYYIKVKDTKGCEANNCP